MNLELCSTTEFFVILGHFLPFPPTNSPKNENFQKKIKKTKNVGIPSFYTCVPQMTVIYMVPEIWSMTDRTCEPELSYILA